MTELWPLLDLYSIYRRLVPSFASKISALNKLPRKNVRKKIDLDEKRKATVDKLKNKLISSPIMALALEVKPLVIETDAYETQDGWVLLEEHDENDSRPVT